MKKSKNVLIIQLTLGLLIILSINIIGNFAFLRFDLTAEKRYTLSQPTKVLLQNLDDLVYFRVYLKGEFPSGFKRLERSTKEMLDEFRAYSKGNIEYEFINPSENSNKKERNEGYNELVKQGLQPTSLELSEQGGSAQKIIFPGAILTYQERELPLQLLKSQIGAHPEVMINNSIEGLEYELCSVIRKLTVNFKPKIGFIEGHGELSKIETQSISNTLSEHYRIDRLELNGKLDVLKGYKAIVIAKPTKAFSEEDKFIIDQFIMQGGKVLWFIDAVSASMDSLSISPFAMGIPNELNLDDQLFRYGVRINKDLTQDLQSGLIPINTALAGSQPKWDFFPWVYFPLLMSTSNHPIVSNLNAVKCEFASSIDTVSAPGINKKLLLKTSQTSRSVNSPVKISLQMIKSMDDEKLFNQSFLPIAVLLDGEFSSIFENRIPSAIANDPSIGFKAKGIRNQMIVVSDGDIIRNQVQYSSGKAYPLGVDKYTGQEYGNMDFVLNCIDYLCDDTGMMSVRSRELKIRLLDKAKLQNDKFKWQLINVLLPILIVLLTGIVLLFLRKRKYS